MVFDDVSGLLEDLRGYGPRRSVHHDRGVEAGSTSDRKDRLLALVVGNHTHWIAADWAGAGEAVKVVLKELVQFLVGPTPGFLGRRLRGVHNERYFSRESNGTLRGG